VGRGGRPERRRELQLSPALKREGMDRNSKLEESFDGARLWRREAIELRKVLARTGLAEEFKWGKPCYTHDGKNICIIQRMNGFLALLFFKGALLKDRDNVLEAQGPNSRSGYRMRFTSVRDVAKMTKSVEAYVREAIEVEKAGLKVETRPDLEYPEELVERFVEDPELKAAFDRLTPGRKRGYVLHFSDARQAKTRAARIAKCRPKILSGKGFQEQ
jgi:uncharacterized protein YdeI (YjbR/CyaY-like superfamily)